MTRVIGVISGKGGVGKTTTVANLACALVSKFGKTVTVVDGNLSASNLGLSYGIYGGGATLNHVLRGEAYMTEAMQMHPSGVWVVPASLDWNEFRNVDMGHLGYAVDQLFAFSDFVILDSAPGTDKEALWAIAASREVLFITTPHMPSIVNAVKSYQLSRELRGKALGVVVNRVKGKKYEYLKDEVEKMCKIKVIAEIPEDDNVLRSANSTKPAIMSNPFSPASIAFTKLAADLVGEKYRPRLSERLNFLVTKSYHPPHLRKRFEHYQKSAGGRLRALRKSKLKLPQLAKA